MTTATVQRDEHLIEQVREGNTEAFRTLVKRYENRVAQTVKGMLGDCPEAEDVGQEVFIRFYKKIDQFEGNAALSTYLTRIAINLSLNALKKRKRRQLLGLEQRKEQSMPEISDEGESLYKRDIKEWVHQALQQLAPGFKSVIILRLIEGYNTQETAQILNIPEGTVLSRLARAQKKMKEILTKWES